jgi:beta-glucanase (GH16 family)
MVVTHGYYQIPNEYRVKMPQGEWLRPVIWMLSVNNTCGVWPRSGSMKIAELLGNGYNFRQGGNVISSMLHKVPEATNDAWWRKNIKRQALHTTQADSCHTFGVKWSKKYVFTYVDNRLLQVTYVPFSQPLWTKRQFPLAECNGTTFDDP